MKLAIFKTPLYGGENTSNAIEWGFPLTTPVQKMSIALLKMGITLTLVASWHSKLHVSEREKVSATFETKNMFNLSKTTSGNWIEVTYNLTLLSIHFCIRGGKICYQGQLICTRSDIIRLLLFSCAASVLWIISWPSASDGDYFMIWNVANDQNANLWILQFPPTKVGRCHWQLSLHCQQT